MSKRDRSRSPKRTEPKNEEDFPEVMSFQVGKLRYALCEDCKTMHVHSARTGHRTAHCAPGSNRNSPHGYFLVDTSRKDMYDLAMKRGMLFQYLEKDETMPLNRSAILDVLREIQRHQDAKIASVEDKLQKQIAEVRDELRSEVDNAYDPTDISKFRDAMREHFATKYAREANKTRKKDE